MPPRYQTTLAKEDSVVEILRFSLQGWPVLSLSGNATCNVVIEVPTKALVLLSGTSLEADRASSGNETADQSEAKESTPRWKATNRQVEP